MILFLLLIYFLIKKLKKMKHIKILNWFRVFLVTILATFTLASCDSKVSEQSTTADQEVSMDDVQENLETTYQTFEGYLYDQKKKWSKEPTKEWIG